MKIIYRKYSLMFTLSIIAYILFFIKIGQSQPVYDVQNPPRIVEFMGSQPMTRVNRPFGVTATVYNPSSLPVKMRASLLLQDNIKNISPSALEFELASNAKRTVNWTISADKEIYRILQLVLTTSDNIVISASQLPVRFLPAMKKSPMNYIPQPEKRRDENKLLVGAHYFPGWDKDMPQLWNQLMKHPERTPALGFYDQRLPEVSDWETKWAVDHGIDFFIYCWYRTSQGGPVEQFLGSALEGRNESSFQDKMKFTIMWENQSKGKAGVSDEDDLMKNLLPFWMKNYFKSDSYLKIDNKPVLFIYRPEFLVDDLGSIENVRSAFDKMRQDCVKEGFDGLWLLGEYRGQDENHFELMKSLGLDYTFAYCWHVKNSPSPQQAIDSQMVQINKTQELSKLPQVVTVSQGWSGWSDEGSIWTIPPIEFEVLLRQAKGFVETLPKNQLNGRMLLLDNWNEWSEGHYLAPYTEHGFGYLDAIRRVFVNTDSKHVDLIPEDIGRGSYEKSYRQLLSERRK